MNKLHSKKFWKSKNENSIKLHWKINELQNSTIQNEISMCLTEYPRKKIVKLKLQIKY